MDKFANLIAENDELKEEIIQLRKKLAVEFIPTHMFGLSRQQWKVVYHLAVRGFATRSNILYALYLNSDSAASEEMIRVLICSARKKLKPYGVEILTVWGQGYKMPKASGEIIMRAVIEAQNE